MRGQPEKGTYWNLLPVYTKTNAVLNFVKAFLNLLLILAFMHALNLFI